MGINVCIRALADVEQINACKVKITELDDGIKSLSGILNLAGNEVRLKILFLLNIEKELCVCDLSDILGMNVSAISQHLRKLKDAGMIHNRKEAQTIYYSILPEMESLLQPFFALISANETVKI